MNRQQFLEIFNGVRNERKYSGVETERIFHHVQHLTQTEFHQIVNKFLDTGGKPNVKDFKNAAIIVRPLPQHTDKKIDLTFDCKKCEDTGIVELLFNDINCFANCFCAKNAVLNLELPTYPAPKTINAKYIGPCRVTFKPGVDSAFQSMEHYKAKLRLSEQFWKGLDDEKSI